jgi:hypothetical protein
MKAFVQDLYNRNRQFYEDPRGKGALRDLQQTFPHPWLYVAELLQNAVDEGAKRIHITVEDGERLIFEHDGKPFDEQNVESLCARGVSSKGISTVGFMGVGFKAVFRSFESVQVSSGSWRFSLTVPAVENGEFGDLQRDWLGAVLPQWDGEALPPSAGMTCRFVLFGCLLNNFVPVSADLERVFGDDYSLLALLAWRGIEEMDWNGEQWRLARSEMPLDGGEGSRVILEARDTSGTTLHRWILFSAIYQPSRAASAGSSNTAKLAQRPKKRKRSTPKRIVHVRSRFSATSERMTSRPRWVTDLLLPSCRRV